LKNIAYEIIKDLSDRSHFYDSTISDCLEYFLFKRSITITDSQKQEILSEVKKTFILLRKEAELEETCA